MCAITRSFCEAFSDCVLGLILIDLVGQNRSNVAKMQASTTAARVTGSVVAYIAGVGIYGCSSDASLDSTTVITMTAVFPICAAFIALYLPDSKVGWTPAKLALESSFISNQWVRAALGVCLIEFTIIWTSVQPLVALPVWLSFMILSCTACLCAMLFAYWRGALRGAMTAALFLFLLNAVPSPDDAWFSFSYSVLSQSQCALQCLSLLGECSSFLACLAFGPLYKRMPERNRVEITLISFVLISCTAFLLNAVLVSNRGGDIPVLSFAIVGFVTSFFGRLAFLAQQTFANERCYSAKILSPGVMYGIYLSFLDFGDSASAWLSAPLISAFGVEFGTQSWNGLLPLIVINVCIQVFVICMGSPLLWMEVEDKQPEYSRVGG